jgi:signal transduction histidine kinase
MLDTYSTLDAFKAFALIVSFVLGVVAAAHWLASYVADRLAMRVFAARYGIAALAWGFVFPGNAQTQLLSAPAVVFAITTVSLHAVAMLLYLDLFTRRVAALVAAVWLVGIAVLLGAARLEPAEPRPVYLFLATYMLVLSALVWHAARRERNMGHGIIAVAMLSYPVVVIPVIIVTRDLHIMSLGQLAVFPTIVVGIATLLASMIRFNRQLGAELARRQAAEAALNELNATLEQRVADRTVELAIVVEGLEAFNRNVAHDLRGPLSGVAGVAALAEQALQRGDTAQAQRLISPIREESERLTSLVHDLGTLAGSNQAPPPHVRTPMNEPVREALAELAMDPAHAKLLAAVDLEVAPLPVAAGAPGLLRQVFVNLIGNALRFASCAECPRVRIGARETADGTAFYVQDNGPGIPPDKEAQLFQPFAKLHGEGLSRTGVGLSIVQRIMRHHRGHVWTERPADGGACFVFTLGGTGADAVGSQPQPPQVQAA